MPLRRRRLRPRPVQQLINYALDTLIYEYLLSPYGARAYNQLDMICYICMYVFFSIIKPATPRIVNCHR